MKNLLFLFLYTLNIYAQALTLPQALELIKAQNLEVQAAEYELQSSRHQYEMADAQHFGQLNFIQNISRTNDAANAFVFKLSSREASFADFGFADFNPSNPNILQVQPRDLNYPKDQNFFQSKLRYELPLYTGSKISAYANMAKQMQEISRLDKQAQLNTKRYETRKSFFDMALLQSSLENLTIIHTNILRLQEVTKEMIKEGYAKKVDLLEVQSKEANVARIIVELKANEELLYHYLSFLLNQEVTEIEVPKYDLNEVHVSESEILENNIDIQKALTALKVRENMLVAQESKYLPTIGAMAEVQTAADSFLADAKDHSSYTLGLQLKWNLFAGGSDNAAIEQARVQSLKMQTQTLLAKKGILLQLNKIQTNIKMSNSKIKSLNLELSLAKAIYENYENRYKEQLSSMNDVIIKQSNWLEKVLELLKVKNQRNTQIFALEKLAALSQGDES